MNRNFISALTHAATELSTEISSTKPQPTDSQEPHKTTDDPGAANAGTAAPDPNSMRLLNPASNPVNNDSSVTVNNIANNEVSVHQQHDTPSNLLVIYLQACSSALQETRMDNANTYDTTKLFMLILNCISEDQYANSLLHDSNILYGVFLYQAVCIFYFVLFGTPLMSSKT